MLYRLSLWDHLAEDGGAKGEMVFKCPLTVIIVNKVFFLTCPKLYVALLRTWSPQISDRTF